MIIGLTGKLCTGKNRIGSIMQSDGWFVIDVDFLGHAALKQGRAPLVEEFGEGILDKAGEIDRKALGAMVFDSPAKLAFLESVSHPLMLEMCMQMIRDRDTERYPKGSVLNAAVLHKMGLNKLCNVILYVQALPLIRFYRAASTRNMSLSEFIRRNRVQRTIEPKYFFDEVPMYVIMNNDGDSRLRKQLQAMYVHMSEVI